MATATVRKYARSSSTVHIQRLTLKQRAREAAAAATARSRSTLHPIASTSASLNVDDKPHLNRCIPVSDTYTPHIAPGASSNDTAADGYNGDAHLQADSLIPSANSLHHLRHNLQLCNNVYSLVHFLAILSKNTAVHNNIFIEILDEAFEKLTAGGRDIAAAPDGAFDKDRYGLQLGAVARMASTRIFAIASAPDTREPFAPRLDYQSLYIKHANAFQVLKGSLAGLADINMTTSKVNTSLLFFPLRTLQLLALMSTSRGDDRLLEQAEQIFRKFYLGRCKYGSHAGLHSTPVAVTSQITFLCNQLIQTHFAAPHIHPERFERGAALLLAAVSSGLTVSNSIIYTYILRHPVQSGHAVQNTRRSAFESVKKAVLSSGNVTAKRNLEDITPDILYVIKSNRPYEGPHSVLERLEGISRDDRAGVGSLLPDIKQMLEDYRAQLSAASLLSPATQSDARSVAEYAAIQAVRVFQSLILAGHPPGDKITALIRRLTEVLANNGVSLPFPELRRAAQSALPHDATLVALSASKSQSTSHEGKSSLQPETSLRQSAPQMLCLAIEAGDWDLAKTLYKCIRQFHDFRWLHVSHNEQETTWYWTRFFTAVANDAIQRHTKDTGSQRSGSFEAVNSALQLYVDWCDDGSASTCPQAITETFVRVLACSSQDFNGLTLFLRYLAGNLGSYSDRNICLYFEQISKPVPHSTGSAAAARRARAVRAAEVLLQSGRPTTKALTFAILQTWTRFGNNTDVSREIFRLLVHPARQSKASLLYVLEYIAQAPETAAQSEIMCRLIRLVLARWQTLGLDLTGDVLHLTVLACQAAGLSNIEHIQQAIASGDFVLAHCLIRVEPTIADRAQLPVALAATADSVPIVEGDKVKSIQTALLSECGDNKADSLVERQLEIGDACAAATSPLAKDPIAAPSDVPVLEQSCSPESAFGEALQTCTGQGAARQSGPFLSAFFSANAREISLEEGDETITDTVSRPATVLAMLHDTQRKQQRASPPALAAPTECDDDIPADYKEPTDDRKTTLPNWLAYPSSTQGSPLSASNKKMPSFLANRSLPSQPQATVLMKSTGPASPSPIPGWPLRRFTQAISDASIEQMAAFKRLEVELRAIRARKQQDRRNANLLNRADATRWLGWSEYAATPWY
ncbi:hypothetical protein EMMF5_006067 [Cystobasidiomycetes sp. EMM_F5]